MTLWNFPSFLLKYFHYTCDILVHTCLNYEIRIMVHNTGNAGGWTEQKQKKNAYNECVFPIDCLTIQGDWDTPNNT